MRAPLLWLGRVSDRPRRLLLVSSVVLALAALAGPAGGSSLCLPGS